MPSVSGYRLYKFYASSRKWHLPQVFPPLSVGHPVAFSKDGVQLRGVITAVKNDTYTIRITHSAAENPARGSGLAVGDLVDEAKGNVRLHHTNANNTNMGRVGGRRRKRKTSKKSKKSKRSRKSVRK